MAPRARQLIICLRTRPNGGPEVYCGVEDFSAKDGTCVMPQWMMKKLRLREGLSIFVTAPVDLPQANFCALTPQTNDFFNEKDHRATLESSLQKYSALTVGDIIELSHEGRNFQVEITELEPEASCCILGDDVEVDVRGQAGNQLLDSSSITSDCETKKKSDILELIFGADPLVSMCNDEEYQIFKFQTPKNGCAVECRAEEANDLEFYISDDCKDASREYHILRCVTSDSVGGGIINVDYMEATLYVVVKAYNCSNCSFRIALVDKILPKPSCKIIGNIQSPSGDSIQCKNCMELVPKAQFSLHSAYCERHNLKCKVCDRVIRKSKQHLHWHCPDCTEPIFITDSLEGKKKHLSIVHKPIECPDCSSSFSGLDALVNHRRKLCPERMHRCRFCHNILKRGHPPENWNDRIRGFSEHESFCGSQTTECDICKARVPLKEIQAHMRLHSSGMISQHQNYKLTPQHSDKQQDELEQKSQFHDEIPKKTVLERKRPEPLCSNPLCSKHQVKASWNTLKLCSVCMRFMCNLSANRNIRAAESWPPKIWFTSLVKLYFIQLSKGCENDKCCNVGFCLTCNNDQSEEANANEVAALALKLAKETQSAPRICVDAETRDHNEAARRLSNLGFPLEWCVSALKACDGVQDAAAGWLLNQNI
eukprot:UC4_evm1s321